MIALKKGETFTTTIFGEYCPYWTKGPDDNVYIADTLDEIISIVPPEQRYIDATAIASYLQFNYIHGNRTFVKGISRIPWRATLRGDGIIIREPPIPHKNEKKSSKEVAKDLKHLLLNESQGYIRGHSHVHLLLSGGYDSRVTAGLLHILQNEISFQVTVVTWGLDKSRDVVYAKKIAELYSWEFIHIPIDEKTLQNNIFDSISACGSEVAGIHLHGGSWFKNLKKSDLILASSFGDSIGRGEFSGQNLKDIKMRKFLNVYKLIFPNVYRECLHELNQDRATAFEKAEDNQYSALCELDQQENYMRRMIVHAMGYLKQWVDLKQMFTSKEVVEYVWSLDPNCRNFEVYRELFKIIDNNLYSLPWARTGVAFDGAKELNENLTKEFHEYDRWLRNDLYSMLYDLTFKGGLGKLNVLNQYSIHQLWKGFDKGNCDSQMILKIAQLEILREKYQIKGVERTDNAMMDLGTKLSTVSYWKRLQIKSIIDCMISHINL